MCEICGGPHFTVKCPQYEGSSARCDANPFMCQNCGIPHISIFCPYSPRYSTRYTNPIVQPQPYFSQGYSLQGYDNRPYYNDLYQQSQCNLVQTSDRGFEGSMSRIEEMFAQIMTQQAHFIVKNQASLETMADFAERSKKRVEELVRERVELEKVEEESDEEIIPVTKTIMDDEVPPPVQKGIIYDFGSDSDDEIDDEEWAAYQRSLVKREVVEEEVGLGDSTDWMFEEEEEVEQPSNEDHMSWENEFREELDGLPVDEEVKEFDPEGDLAYLEVLLEGSPMTEIKEEEVVVEEEEHHSWPVVEVIKDSRPREKAKKRRKKKVLNRKRIEGWGEMERKEPFTRDHSSRYMPRIRFLPGMFKFWWSDPFQNFKILYNSTNLFLKFFEVRVELNGLDRVQVKEKPPD
ncbi:hypothetical protein HanIR_Chr12g0604601 [Helianthus annuus]|nr:hypothetical protein HanIR_Chr12g0604601 [Helianthus annuus]